MKKAGRILLSIQMAFLMFSGLLRDLGVPYFLMYLVDVSNGALLLCILLEKNKNPLQDARFVLCAMVIWLGYMLFFSAVNHSPFALVIWAMRNWVRGFVVFIACLLFMSSDDVYRLIRFMFILYAFQFFLILYQFSIMGYLGPKGYVGYLTLYDPDYCVQDSIGGIFGQAVGGNGWNNVFLCAMLLIALCGDYEKRRLSFATVFVMMSSMVVAAILELKVFFFEFAVIQVAVPVLFSLRNRADCSLLKKMLLCAGVSFGVGLLLLSVLYPKHFWVIIGKRSLGEYESLASAAYKISRLKFIPEINELFLQNLPKQLFGLGFGNCEYSSVYFFLSDFSYQYEEYGYHFFSHQTLYLEGGLIGLVLYIMIPLSAAIEQGIAILKKKPMLGVRVFGCLFAGLTAVKLFYNNAMRTELCYLNFFILAMIYVVLSKKQLWGETA